MKYLLAVSSVLAFCVASVHAQVPAAAVFSGGEISHYEQQMRTEAATANGLATKVLARYPHSYMELVLRTKGGQVEVHQHYADVMTVIEGHASLVSGGTMKNGQQVKPGEIRGDSIEGGSRSALGPGDLVHVPANLPHQVLLPPGGLVFYLVIKVEAQGH